MSMDQYRVRWTKRALRRLDEIGDYISEDDPTAAERVLARIVTSVDFLRTYPLMGRVGRIKAAREVVLRDVPYIIVYRMTPSEIVILTVMHTSRKWPLKL